MLGFEVDWASDEGVGQTDQTEKCILLPLLLNGFFPYQEPPATLLE